MTDTNDTGGASNIWTATGQQVSMIRQMLLEGRLTEAERAATGNGRFDAEARDLIRRLRHEFSLDAEALLEKIRKLVPSASADDLARWTTQRAVAWRVLDGRVKYFRREPGNLFRFDAVAKDMLAKAKAQSGSTEAAEAFALDKHLAEVLALAQGSGQVMVHPVRHRVTYQLTVKPNRPDVRPGELVRCWLPMAMDYASQRDVVLVSTDPKPAVVSGAESAHRTVYLERLWEKPDKPLVFEVKFDVTVWAQVPRLEEKMAIQLEEGFDPTYLQERQPHVVFTPAVKELAASITQGVKNPLARARAIFHWVDANIPWNAEMEYCLLPNLVEKALTTRRGDCGVQAMTFITLCRAAGVPARWQSGWQTQPGNLNMHDWAEFYVRPWGWLPVDASFGRRKSDDPQLADFYFGHMDAYRIIVNSDYGRPLHPPKLHLRSEPADFQRGEVEIAKRNFYFDEWEWDIKVEHERK